MPRIKYRTQISMEAPAEEAFDVVTKELADTKAPLASPTFTGTPRAPTPPTVNNSTQLATTAFVKNSLESLGISTGTPLKFVGTITGDGSATSFIVTHNLNTKNVIVKIYGPAGNEVLLGVNVSGPNYITLSSNPALQAGNVYSVVILGGII